MLPGAKPVPAIANSTKEEPVTRAERLTGEGDVLMSTTQAFLLGIMVAWTPTLVFLAWSLRHSVDDDLEGYPMLDE